MEEELGWSRSIFFGALSVRYLLAGMLGPIVGQWADRTLAPRLLLPIGVLMLGSSLSLVRWIEHPLLFFLGYGVLGAFGSALLHLQFWEAIILKWFSRKRTRALVIANVGEASGPLIFPIAITGLVAIIGWRDAWFWYGIATIVVLLPFAFLVRTRPEHVGQTVDNLPPLTSNSLSRHTTQRDVSFRRAEAVRTRSFWLLAVAYTITGFSVTGFQSQWIPHFQDVGFSAAIAATAVSVYGASNIVSRLIWGALAEFFTVRFLLASHAIAAGIGVMILITLVTNPVTLIAWAIYQGLVLGSFFQLHTLLMTDYFGRMHIGSVRGLLQPPSSMSRAAGALAFAAMRDWRGDYAAAFGVVIGLWAVIAGLALGSKRPKTDSE